MAESMLDQLRKAGLASDEQTKRAKKEKYKQGKQKKGKKGALVDESKERIKQAMAAKAAADRALNAERDKQAEARSVAAQVRQLVEMNRQPREAGEIAYNFSDGSVIKQLYVTEDQRNALVQGRLAVVKIDDIYELVPTGAAEKIRARDDSVVVALNEADTSNDIEDEYAEFKVPDDLMW